MPDVVRPLEPDLPAGQALDPEDEPVECRADAEIVENRQAQVAADRPQAVGDGPPDVGALRVARRLQPADQEGQLLERIVVDVGRQTSPLRFRGSDDQVALEGGAGRQASEGADREPARDEDRDEPDQQRPEVGSAVGAQGEQGRCARDRQLGRPKEAAGTEPSAGTEPIQAQRTRRSKAGQDRNRADEGPAQQPRRLGIVSPRVTEGQHRGGDGEHHDADAHEPSLISSGDQPAETDGERQHAGDRDETRAGLCRVGPD